MEFIKALSRNIVLIAILLIVIGAIGWLTGSSWWSLLIFILLLSWLESRPHRRATAQPRETIMHFVERNGTSFLCGWMAAIGLMMAFQDWLGLERYIEHARAHWVELHWIVGFTIFTVAVLIHFWPRINTK